MKTYLNRLLKLFVQLVLCLGIFSCSGDESEFYYANLETPLTPQPAIVIASAIVNEAAIVMYDLNGNLIRTLKNYAPDTTIPRSLFVMDNTSFLIATDTADRVDWLGIDGVETTYINSNDLAGNIFHMRRHPTHGTFVIETNAIESFDDQNRRIGGPRIGTPIGGCVLNVARGMTFNTAGQLIVVGTGNDAVNVYDVTDPVNTLCVRANTTMGNVDPVAVMQHSNGLLYIATQGDDRIYSMAADGTGTATVVFNNINFINNPTALAEMPDGTILVASDGTNSIVRITTAGALVGLTDFISDAFTNTINDMIILPEGDQ